ncbi:hypothetical protein, partial [Rummeliibacillus suwonensis]|uniref:hypothetical protein n=1 Tax=Rummeliibacillus suwonensis TaxID=1306154 RepID=UPI00289C693B
PYKSRIVNLFNIKTFDNTEDAAGVFIMDPHTNVTFKDTIKGYKTYPIYVQDLSSVYLDHPQ